MLVLTKPLGLVRTRRYEDLPLLLTLILGAYAATRGFVLAQGLTTITIKHDEGSATIKKNPQRIIAMDEESLGWLAALGLQDRIVGIGSTYFEPADLNGTRIKPEVLERGFYGRVNLKNPAYIGNWETPNLETLTALKPDLIVRLTWGRCACCSLCCPAWTADPTWWG